ncbi:histidine phosphatase family protein [Arthrobacter sp. 35W]|uniref:histidine phosphatase family protein n=1 Tax=Arthrobacter sp. 35W TaxID=1132441 RepID=UPI000414B9EB|nr:histidine phosphatase family protein [Arthrobacter sp. 35W]
MRLILIRHGQTPSNLENLLDTAFPGPGLTEEGVRQAEGLPTALAGEHLGAIYASTLTRTQATAAPLAAELDLEVQIEAGLREISAGTLEMKGDTASIMAYLGTLKRWMQGEPDVRMDGADTGTEVLARFDDVVRRAEDAADGGTVAMVSHGAMIRFWAGCRASNLDWTDKKYFELDNTGIVILEGTMAGPGSPAGAWKILQWHGRPAAGSDTQSGPLADMSALPVEDLGLER